MMQPGLTEDPTLAITPETRPSQFDAGTASAGRNEPTRASVTRTWPRADTHQPAKIQSGDHGWHQVAVFYEVIVRSYVDSNRDGIGDLPGLTEKLDYLQWLGVDCLWLPPFYPSPLRDGGYDVADHTNVDPAVGTLDDFATFLDAAHARSIKVIIDFVLNHTSDQHPWFRESRRGSIRPIR
jgi:1,4-alpha-glucan branching enzyme